MDNGICYIKFHKGKLMLWEVDINFPGETPDGVNLRVLVRGPTVTVITEQCHRAYPNGRINCIFKSAVEEICPGTHVLPKKGGSNE